jgi:4-hydroxy-2-oxoheptanedioate aldolase
MIMKKNLLKEKLERGDVTAGVVIGEPGTQVIEILGLLDFDWLFIDCEHSPMSLESVAQIVITAERREITPVVRVPQNVPEIILRYLDVGVMGVIIPEVSSREEAERSVHAVKYPPDGDRGLAGVRAADYGLRGSLGDYTKMANLETIVLADLESPDGVEHAEEILGVRGIDGAIMGANDLSKSLGVPGQTNHPLVLEAADKILTAGKRTGKPIGAIVRGGETPKQYIEKGYRMLVTSVNGLLITAAKQFLMNARDHRS